jgi:predicted MarR family transcription regulator
MDPTKQRSEPEPDVEKPDDLAHYRGWHLAETHHEARLTEFEYGILRFREAFEHWVLQGMRAVFNVELSFEETCILHPLRMQARPTGVSTIARLLNRDDVSNLQYSLRKLVSIGLVTASRSKRMKGVSYTLTKAGIRATDEYAKLKRDLLIRQTLEIPGLKDRVEAATRTLTLLTGLYEECARIAASYSPPPAPDRPTR